MLIARKIKCDRPESQWPHYGLIKSNGNHLYSNGRTINLTRTDYTARSHLTAFSVVIGKFSQL